MRKTILVTLVLCGFCVASSAAEVNHDLPAPPGVHPVLRRDAKGEEVRLLQELLNQRTKPVPALAVDGQFGAGTENAVKALQTANKLAADGVMGRDTWEALTGIEVQPQVSTAPQSLAALRKILDRAGRDKATVTSGLRTAVEQARVMYENLEKHGVDQQRKLYGATGDKVIDVYVAFRGKPREEVVGKMKEKIKELGPGNVSKHSSDDRYVIDVAPSTVGDQDKFLAALQWGKEQGFILHFIPPPGDPAFHVELKK